MGRLRRIAVFSCFQRGDFVFDNAPKCDDIGIVRCDVCLPLHLLNNGGRSSILWSLDSVSTTNPLKLRFGPGRRGCTEMTREEANAERSSESTQIRMRQVTGGNELKSSSNSTSKGHAGRPFGTAIKSTVVQSTKPSEGTQNPPTSRS